MTREEAINVMRGLVLADRDREALETILPELKNKKDKNELMKEAIIAALEKYYFSNTVFNGYSKKEMISWVKKQIPPKWLYRLEYKDGTCGLWYNGEGKWCFEQGIGSLVGCKTKDLPMDHDERYKQDGRDWFSSCSNKEDLLHWYSLEDAEELIKKGFVFTRYLATEYHEYENETVFIKESSLIREEIDIFELFGKTNQEFSVGDWVVNENSGTVHQVRNCCVSNDKIAYDLTDGGYIPTSNTINYHLWTIKDAKPGDVIAVVDDKTGCGWLCLIKKINEDNKTFSSYCFIDPIAHFFHEGADHEINEEVYGRLIPAAKEQRDLLFQKMKESGYEWDADKKELNYIPKHKVGDTIYFNSFGETKSMVVNNIITDSTDNPMYEDKDGNSVFEKELIEHNSAWSEEDEESILEICNYLDRIVREDEDNQATQLCVQGLKEWLKSLKERVQLQDRINIEVWVTKNKQWILKLNGKVVRGRWGDEPQCIYKHFFYLNEVISTDNKLDRIQPQNTWKPSDEQIDALYTYLYRPQFSAKDVDSVVSLYQDLKKLREE